MVQMFWYLWILVDSTRGPRLHGRAKDSRDVYDWGDMPCRNFVVDLSWRWFLLSLIVEVFGALRWLYHHSRDEFQEFCDPKVDSYGRDLYPHYTSWGSVSSIETLPWFGACEVVCREKTLFPLCVAEEGVRPHSDAHDSRVTVAPTAVTDRGFSAVPAPFTMDLRERRLAS